MTNDTHIPAPKEQPGPEAQSLKWFVATVCREERGLAFVRIQAPSLEQAKDHAYAFDTSNIFEWKTVYGDDYVETVEPDNGKNAYKFSHVVKWEGTASHVRGQGDE